MTAVLDRITTALDPYPGFAPAAVADPARRRLLTATGAGLFALSGCGVTGGAPERDGGRSGGERTVDTALGKRRVPRSPEKVVALDYFPGLTFVDVGLTPVGVIDYGKIGPLPDRYRELTAEDSKVIGLNGKPDLEAVTSIDPDLIVSLTYPAGIAAQRGLYKQLGGSAPTVVLTMDWQADWTTRTLDIADAVGKRPELERLRKKVRGRADELRRTYARALRGTKWAQISAVESGRWTLYPQRSSLGGLLAMLGVDMVESARRMKEKGGKIYSLEDLDTLDQADVVIHQIDRAAGEPLPPVKSLLARKEWKDLRPVAAGRSHGLRNTDVSSYGWALDALDELEQTVLRPLAR